MPGEDRQGAVAHGGRPRHRQAGAETHRVRACPHDVRCLRIAEIATPDAGLARTGEGVDRGTADGEVAGRDRAHSQVGRDQFPRLRAGRGARPPRHDGAGPGGRTGIPHAPPGRRKAGVRNHRGRGRPLRAAARPTHRRAPQAARPRIGGHGRAAGRLLQRHDAHVVPWRSHRQGEARLPRGARSATCGD